MISLIQRPDAPGARSVSQDHSSDWPPSKFFWANLLDENTRVQFLTKGTEYGGIISISPKP
jgi:hypothetical protein